ncbi:MAG: VWA domain-containing protein [Gammaproteobacteria bacterium]|nr:VWA domain-containing protein [Gammaproteobacteria bacterium]
MKISKQKLRVLAALLMGLIILSACSSNMGGYELSNVNAPSPYRVSAIGEEYAAIRENKFKQVRSEPVSTFSIDVDTAAYANVRRFINDGKLPPVDAVRIEEMINYFDYEYATPESAQIPFHISTELGVTPWNSGSYLMHVGIKAYEPHRNTAPARNLVFLLDVSGSMSASNKLGLLKKSMRLLVRQLTERDRVAIVVYAGASGLVLPSTPAHYHNRITTALESLRAGGSTNGGSGINLAYAVAQRNFIRGGINRVILATDGDFNVGVSRTGELLKLIKQKKRSGVGLTVLGFGMGNYNDQMLEAISNSGDGNAAYIDSLQEAQKVLVNEGDATFHTVAKDTKVQIEFNPQIVSSYRLIGYENRLLNRQDFKNDRIDAGDVGAGHTVTALYEIHINEKLRYSIDDQSNSAYQDELGFLKLRYKMPNQSTSNELVHAITKNSSQMDLTYPSNNFKFSAAVAAFGQLLRESEQIGDYSYEDILALARAGRGDDAYGYRGEFLKLVNLASSLR